MTRARDTAGIIGSNTLTIDGSSNIGIGSTIPGSKFHIDGNTRVSGVLTATTFSGNVTGTAATFTGNVSVAGVLTYEDVTNVDSLGLSTFRSGLIVQGTGSTTTTLNVSGVSTHVGFSTFGNNVFVVGILTAAGGFRGDGSQLTGVSAGLALRQAGSVIAGGAATTVNFASGATITNVTAGIATITIAAGLQTEAATPSGAVVTLDLSKQDHKVTATGIVTVTCSGGTEGDSHTVRIVNSGIATVGFSTYFLFPSGSPPSFPTTSGAISLLSFTVHRVGTAGTQLLAGASLNFS